MRIEINVHVEVLVAANVLVGSLPLQRIQMMFLLPQWGNVASLRMRLRIDVPQETLEMPKPLGMSQPLGRSQPLGVLPVWPRGVGVQKHSVNLQTHLELTVLSRLGKVMQPRRELAVVRRGNLHNLRLTVLRLLRNVVVVARGSLQYLRHR